MKIIRDRIDLPGKTRPVRGNLEKAELLLAKLHEEADEIAADPCDPSEYGDLLDVVEELMLMHRVTLTDVEDSREDKAERLGAFVYGKVLEET